jgi:hypothetical protein
MSRLQRNVARMKTRMPHPLKVTLYPLEPNSELGDGVRIMYANKKPMSLDVRMSLEVEIEAKTCVWMLWAEDVPEALGEIERDWKVVENETGRTWRVLTAELKSFEQRYRLNCIEGISQPS